MNQPMPRREFLRHTAAVGAGLALGSSKALADTVAPAGAVPGASPSPAGGAGDKVVLGVMGCGGRGAGIAAALAALPGAEVRYVCDPDEARAGKAADQVAAKQKGKPQAVNDFRRILDDPAVHGLVVAAPDHWHAPAAILACAAGKHVYVEKPCCQDPREGELLLAAARKHDRVVQHGTQRRSYSHVIEAVKKVRDGELGKVLFSRGWYNNQRGGIGRGKPGPAPAGLDYALWQGPAPERPFRDNILHYHWHWFWHWGTGELGNNGIHALDVCRWGLGVDCPKRVTAGGGRYHFDDDQETPDTLLVTYDFGDKAIAWEGRSCQPRGFEGSEFGIAFYGDAASLVIDGNGYKIFDPKGKETAKASGPAPDAPHFIDFLDCVRAGRRPAADIEEGVKSTLLCHLGNIAWRTGHVLNVDPAARKIVGDPGAEKLWGREYRPGWEPKV